MPIDFPTIKPNLVGVFIEAPALSVAVKFVDVSRYATRDSVETLRPDLVTRAKSELLLILALLGSTFYFDLT